MPDFKDDDFRRVSGEVVADSSDEDIDGVLFKVCMEYLVKKNWVLGVYWSVISVLKEGNS